MAHDTTASPISVSLNADQITRFWTLVERSLDGCWEWRGSKFSEGYGAVSFYGKTFKAHRIAWYLTNGQIPDGHYICHTCDNPGCVRPDHLFAGTPKDNHDDMKIKGRGPTGDRNGLRKHPHRRATGERHPHTKLTDDQVREIRRRFVRFGPYRTNAPTIAKEFGLRTDHVIDIGERRTWRHLD